MENIIKYNLRDVVINTFVSILILLAVLGVFYLLGLLQPTAVEKLIIYLLIANL